MNAGSEMPFRIVIGLSWAVHFGVRLYFQQKVKGIGGYVRVNERRERFLFRLFALGHFVVPLYFVTPWIDFAHLPLPEWLRWLGAGLTCFGIGLFAWAHQALGRNWTAIPALSRTHDLVFRGPYRRVRHPMYSAFFLIGAGYLLASANWMIGVAYLGTLSAMYLARVSVEEEMMLARSGDRYRQYMQKTDRLWPRISR
jgi:protein-S-isoprenylcysteine O-methyltransferase Ste14